MRSGQRWWVSGRGTNRWRWCRRNRWPDWASSAPEPVGSKMPQEFGRIAAGGLMRQSVQLVLYLIKLLHGILPIRHRVVLPVEFTNQTGDVPGQMAVEVGHLFADFVRRGVAAAGGRRAWNKRCWSSRTWWAAGARPHTCQLRDTPLAVPAQAPSMKIMWSGSAARTV